LPSSNYGFALMLGVLYHLRNPFLVLEALARHARHLFVSTRIAAWSPDRKIHYASLPLAYLVDDDELNHDDTNFWIFTEEGFKRVVRSAGWEVLHYTTVGPPESDPISPAGDARGYILARSRLAAPPCGFRMLRGWHQMEYDTWRWTERCFAAQLDLTVPLQ